MEIKIRQVAYARPGYNGLFRADLWVAEDSTKPWNGTLAHGEREGDRIAWTVDGGHLPDGYDPEEIHAAIAREVERQIREAK